MFNRSAIMKAAWATFRRRSTFNGVFVFGANGRQEFAKILRAAWQDAKIAAGDVVAAARRERADAIRDQIDCLKYKSFQMNVEPRRIALGRELSALGA